MASVNACRDLVNQKLHFARLLLAQAVAGSGSEAENRDLTSALCEGAVLHLNRAYNLYLREIADNYQCASDQIYNTGILSAVLAEHDKKPGEVQELINLESDAESWLAQLQMMGHAANRMPVFRAEQPSANSITTVALDSTGLNAGTILHWHEAFVVLLDRQRELMAEC